MLHFPELKATPEEMLKPVQYWNSLKNRIKKCCQNLHDPNKFQVKIIDYGFAKTLGDG